MSAMSELDIERQEGRLTAPTEILALHNDTGRIKLVADGYGDEANRVYIGTGAGGVSLNLNEATELCVQLGQLIGRLRPKPGIARES